MASIHYNDTLYLASIHCNDNCTWCLFMIMIHCTWRLFMIMIHCTWRLYITACTGVNVTQYAHIDALPSLGLSVTRYAHIDALPSLCLGVTRYAHIDALPSLCLGVTWSTPLMNGWNRLLWEVVPQYFVWKRIHWLVEVYFTLCKLFTYVHLVK